MKSFFLNYKGHIIVTYEAAGILEVCLIDVRIGPQFYFCQLLDCQPIKDALLT